MKRLLAWLTKLVHEMAATVTHAAVVVIHAPLVVVKNVVLATQDVVYDAKKSYLWASCLKALSSGQRGAVNMQGFIVVAIGVIMMAVGFIIFPIVITGTDKILSFSQTIGAVDFTTANFTGMTSVTPLVPLLVILGFIVATALTGFTAVQSFRGVAEEVNPGQYLMLGVGMIFIAVALIVFPILLGGVSSAWAAVLASSYASDYTGLTGFLPIAPLLALVGTIFIGVVSEYFGIRKTLTGSYM